jgi:hypothetical protein
MWKKLTMQPYVSDPAPVPPLAAAACLKNVLSSGKAIANTASHWQSGFHHRNVTLKPQDP